MDMDIKILTVNYNTPELIKKLIETYYQYGYDNYQLIIIDGSDMDDNINESIELSKIYKNVIFDFIGFNIHHGPGLHYGMTKYKSDYFLLMDSDSYFIKEGLIDFYMTLISNKYGVGRVIEVNENGCVDKLSDAKKYKYIHPNGCLINYDLYKRFKPIIAHGAPFIQSMISLDETKEKLLVNTKNMWDYLYIGWKGTCGIYGYAENLYDKLNNNKNIYY